MEPALSGNRVAPPSVGGTDTVEPVYRGMYRYPVFQMMPLHDVHDLPDALKTGNMTLERVFRPYFKMMQKSLQKNELFAEDEEIFDIYVDVLEKTGKTVQRSKIGTLI